jgi:hypothetical protein
VLVVGCGSGEHRVPVACFDASLSKALTRAPAAVRLAGGTKLSDCFTRNAQPAELQQVAAVFIAAASRLGDAARARPHSPAATQLGYLVGAVRHGTSHTQGIHYETERRIEQELIGVNTRAPEFVRGERAGEQTG